MKLSTKIVVVAFVAVIALVAVSASAAAFTSNLTVGSRGAEVAQLQTVLGVTPATGYFGSITKAAVVKYQAANNIPATGFVGPLTRAALNGAAPVSGNFPAGCSSAVGYSTTTGLPCAASTNLPAGCVAGAAFSSTTGLSCTGSTVSTAGLQGGAGDVVVTKTSTDVETTVNEGARNVKIQGFKVEADGSDVAVSSVKVNFIADGALSSSQRLSHYVNTVSVYEGSTKVGSANVADFTKDGNNYSKTIALSNAIVREGVNQKATFYVTVDAVENIDTTDFNANWTASTSNMRFNDATGAILTASLPTLDSTFKFSSLASSGDVKVVVSKDASSPVAGNVAVSDTASTKNVLMLAFKIRATGSDVSFDTLTASTTLVGLHPRSDIIGELQLKHGSTVLATVDGSDVSTSTTFTLDDTYTIDADTTDVFTITATINDSDNFTSGNGISVSLPTSFAINPEDSNGDTVVDTGSATGEVQTFVTAGPQVRFVSSSYTAPNVTDSIDGTLSMKFSVTALGDEDVTIAEDQFTTSKTSGVASQTAGAGIVVFNVSGATTTDARISSTDVTKDGSNNFTVTAGDTATFTLTIKLSSVGTTGFVRGTITDVDNTPITNTVQTSDY